MRWSSWLTILLCFWVATCVSDPKLQAEEQEGAAECLAPPRAFIVPVSVRQRSDLGEGQMGVFADADIAADTAVWRWTDLVKRVPKEEVAAFLRGWEDPATVLRQSFVAAADPNFLNVNQGDAGRFVNHSPNPTLGGPKGHTLRHISAGCSLPPLLHPEY